MAVASKTSEPLASRRTREVRRGDRIFRGLTQGAGLLILGLIVAIAVFLVWKAIPAFRAAGFGFLTEKTWFPDATPPRFGVAALPSAPCCRVCWPWCSWCRWRSAPP